MKIYAISDLHLDYEKKKPMDIFGEEWVNHEEKIFENWQKKICNEDLVLLAGDISWAISLEKAKNDLKRIDVLKGRKIVSKGNHDYWWTTKSKLNKLGLETIDFLQTNSFQYKNVQIFGTRGWIDKSSEEFDLNKDEKILNRELKRLELSFQSGQDISQTYNIVLIHYPPFDKEGKPNEFTRIMKKYNVKKCIYGHLHSKEGHRYVIEGKLDNIEYICTAADYINFDPIKVMEI